MSMGRMRLRVRTPKSWDPPTKKKVPRPNHRKTLHPMGRRSPPGRVDTPRLLLVGHNPLRGVVKLVSPHDLIELGILKAVSVPARKIKNKWCRNTDLAFHLALETQNIVKSIQLRSPGNKLVPLPSTQIKTNKRKSCIIWARCTIEVLQKKCGINATKEIPLVSIGSKASRNQCPHMILMLPHEGIRHDSSIR